MEIKGIGTPTETGSCRSFSCRSQFLCLIISKNLLSLLPNKPVGVLCISFMVLIVAIKYLLTKLPIEDPLNKSMCLQEF